MFQNMVKKSRLHERKPLAKFGFIQISGDDGGQILNISDEGLCFQTFAPIGTAKNLQFWFSLNLRDRIEANGQVAWLDAETKVGGLRFQNLTERAIKHIRTYATGARNEDSCERGSFFAATLATALPSTQSGRSQAEASASPVAGTRDSQFYRPADRSTEARLMESTHVESTDLISLQRHLAVCRRRLVLGFVLGVLATSSLGLLLVPYVINRARTPVSQAGPAVTSLEKPASVQPSANPFGDAIPQMTKNSTVENALRMAASRAYVAKPSTAISAETASPSLSKSANTGSATGSPSVTKASATPAQLWSAVQSGDSNAAVVLADRYMRGDGVPPNCVQARVLLLVASERNNATAIKKLHELDKNGCS